MKLNNPSAQKLEGYEDFKGFPINSTVICVDASDCVYIKEGQEYIVRNEPYYHNMRGAGVEIESLKVMYTSINTMI